MLIFAGHDMRDTNTSVATPRRSGAPPRVPEARSPRSRATAKRRTTGQRQLRGHVIEHLGAVFTSRPGSSLGIANSNAAEMNNGGDL